MPEQDVLLTSGPIKRSTGVYFKLLPTSQTTLEESRIDADVSRPSIVARGILRVDCLARGKRSYMGIEDSVVAAKAEFVTAVHLQGDTRARDLAISYSNHVQRLRNLDRQLRNQKPRDNWFQKIEALVFEGSKSKPVGVSQLVLVSSPSKVRALTSRMDPQLRPIADAFLAARQDMDNLGR